MAGLGQGFAYSGALSNSLRLFPDKRGLASGILTGGMGFAAVIASPVASSLIQQQDAFFAFRTIGLVYIVVIICGIFSLRQPQVVTNLQIGKLQYKLNKYLLIKTGKKCYKVRYFTLLSACSLSVLSLV